ncbi:DNA cytosine methyltransferase [Streptomyces sp. NPDC047049]|uniref:DNA cytosine methyltransferase n=1 Tax=Streptomyces sp. NPDC047049 TaxID=3156688 RepID=UPI0033CF4795
MTPQRFTSLEICAGTGGQALGLETAGFDPVALVENDRHSCTTLRTNRPAWNVLEMDVLEFDPAEHTYTYDVDLLSAGLPRVRAVAAAARGSDDHERRLLRATVLLTSAVLPRAVLIENVPKLVTADAFEELRTEIKAELEHLGYRLHWGTVNAKDFGVAQDREQGVLVALKGAPGDAFRWPEPSVSTSATVGDVLHASMATLGWPYADRWAAGAQRPAPTLVGGSKKHGGADLGPSGTKRAWAAMGLSGWGVGDAVPGPDTVWVTPGGDGKSLPKLTIQQIALLQAFPTDWQTCAGKTSQYRQLAQASPPPVAAALGRSIATALASADRTGP